MTYRVAQRGGGLAAIGGCGRLLSSGGGLADRQGGLAGRFRATEGRFNEAHGPLGGPRLDPAGLGGFDTVRTPAAVGDASAALQNLCADGAAIAKDAPRQPAAVEEASGKEASAAELRAVAERPALQGQADVDSLMHQNAGKVVRVDLEVDRRELDHRLVIAPSVAVDHGSSRAPESSVPAHRELWPGGQEERLADGLQRAQSFILKGLGRKHQTIGYDCRPPPRPAADTMARMTRTLLLASLLALLAALAGCGDEDGFDRSNVNTVYERAMAAVFDADWKTLQGLLTKRARFTMEHDLERLRRRLAHPVDGKREREIAAVLLGSEADAAIEQAAQGGLGDALRVLVRISPRDRTPARKGVKLAKFKASMLYQIESGKLLSIRLVLQPKGWFVDELQL
jgi:hypothetical protein